MTILKTDTSTLGALNATTVSIDISDADDVGIAVVGTFVGTVSFYVSIDNVDFFSFAMHQTGNGAGTTDVLSTASQTMFSKDCAPFKYFKAIMTAYTSGSAVATIVSSRTSK